MGLLAAGSTFTDDAGKPVRILHPAGAADWPMDGDPRIDALKVRMRAVMSTPRLRVAIMWIGLAVVYIGARALTHRLYGGFPGWMGWVVFIAVFAAAGPVLLRLRTSDNAKELARLLIEEGLCPGCGYNFHGLERSATGKLQCPECGSAWREERIRRVEPFATGVRSTSATTVLSAASTGTQWVGMDDDGRRMPLVHPRLRQQLRRCESAERRSRLISARAEISRSGWIIRWVVAITLTAVGVWLGNAIIQSSGQARLTWGTMLSAAIAPAACLLIGLLVLFTNFCYGKAWIKKVMLEKGMCPSCGGDMQHAAALVPGLRECPFCLSLWKDRPAG